MAPSLSEDLCLHCGRCCHASVIAGKGRICVPELHCKHLCMEGGTSSCRVYGERHEVTDWCFPMAQSIENQVFPPDCPYVAEIEGYVGARHSAFYGLMRSDIRAAMAADGMPSWVDPLEWARYLNPPS